MRSYWPARRVRSVLFFVLIASGFTIAPDNKPPQVDAGPDQTVVFPTANLNGNATDDGFPLGVLITTWSQVSGPGTVAKLEKKVEDPRARNIVPKFHVRRLT